MAMIILIDSMLLSRGRCIHAAIAEVYRLEDIHGQNTLVETWVLQTGESCMSIPASQHAETWSMKLKDEFGSSRLLSSTRGFARNWGSVKACELPSCPQRSRHGAKLVYLCKTRTLS